MTTLGPLDFSSSEHDKFLKTAKHRYNAKVESAKDNSLLQIKNSSFMKGLDKKLANNARMNLAEFVPPLSINHNQRKLLEFLFATKDVDRLVNNRVLIYNGQLNDQCPNFDNPDATQPYVNPITKKVECRVPMPDRTKLVPKTPTPLNCAAYVMNGPNPFAIEKYIRDDGTETCRVPVVRGKFFCNETNPKAPAELRGEHVTLPDGTGVCIPTAQQFAQTNEAKLQKEINDLKNNINQRVLTKKFFPDQAVQAITPFYVKNSPYYSLFSKRKFNKGYLGHLSKLALDNFGNRKNQVYNYLIALRSPMSGIELEAVKGLYSDPKNENLYRFHRDLFWYIKENYPEYLKSEMPKEQYMRFLGYVDEAKIASQNNTRQNNTRQNNTRQNNSSRNVIGGGQENVQTSEFTIYGSGEPGLFDNSQIFA